MNAASYPRATATCTSDSDCYAEFEHCGLDLEEAVCVHKDVAPFLPIEIAGCVVTVLALFYTNCGGIGGGGIMIPVAIFFFGFHMNAAIALSNATVAVAAICRYILNLRGSHPLKEGTGVLVDYNVASIMLPAIVLGVIAGGIINQVFPGYILGGVLLLLLIVLIIATWVKLCQIRKREAEAFGHLGGGGKAKQTEEADNTENK